MQVVWDEGQTKKNATDMNMHEHRIERPSKKKERWKLTQNRKLKANIKYLMHVWQLPSAIFLG